MGQEKADLGLFAVHKGQLASRGHVELREPAVSFIGFWGDPTV